MNCTPLPSSMREHEIHTIVFMYLSLHFSIYISHPFNYHYFPQCLPKGVELNTRIAISIKTSFVISYKFNITVSSDGNRQVQLDFLPKAITGKWIFCFFLLFSFKTNCDASCIWVIFLYSVCHYTLTFKI